MHALVPAEVRELRVGFEAHLALERLHRRVNVRVLLEARRGREGFSALGTSVTTGADVMCSNVSLEIRWIGEFLESNEEVEKLVVVVHSKQLGDKANCQQIRDPFISISFSLFFQLTVA
jgi:hypothetical protein